MLSERRVVLVELPPVRAGVCCAALCAPAGCPFGCPGCAGCVPAAGVAAGGVCCAFEGEVCCGGRLEAVPGIPPPMRVVPLCSSVFCELVITDLEGSNVSSLCSPLVMSMSADTPVRNLSAPSRGSSVLLILAAT